MKKKDQIFVTKSVDVLTNPLNQTIILTSNYKLNINLIIKSQFSAADLQ